MGYEPGVRVAIWPGKDLRGKRQSIEDCVDWWLADHEYHELERRAALDAELWNCGGEQDVGVCRPSQGSGSFHMGAGKFDPDQGAFLTVLLIPRVAWSDIAAYHVRRRV